MLGETAIRMPLTARLGQRFRFPGAQPNDDVRN